MPSDNPKNKPRKGKLKHEKVSENITIPAYGDTQNTRNSAASKSGQIIGGAFEKVINTFVQDYLAEKHSDYELLKPKKAKRLLRLEMKGGASRQLDTVIALKNSDDPVALMETKWLKDGRHHNDKGSWILLMKEIQQEHATIRGILAALAGYWPDNLMVILFGGSGVRAVRIATDEQVYATLQVPFNEYLRTLGKPPITFHIRDMRNSYSEPSDFANFLTKMKNDGTLSSVATAWLKIPESDDSISRPIYGADKIKKAIDELLRPLPANPRIAKFQIALEVETGNVIYEEVSDYEEALEFLRTYQEDPQKVLERITPKSSHQSN